MRASTGSSLSGTALAANGAGVSDDVVGYAPIWLSTLEMMGRFNHDLYILNEGAKKPVLLRSRDHSEDDDAVLSPLVRRGVKKLYVKVGDYARYTEQLEKHLDAILVREDLKPTERCAILQAAVAARVDQAMRLIQCDKAIETSKKIGSQIAELLPGSDSLPSDLFRMVRHDTYTFTHLTNVSCYCVLLAEKLGISDKAELEEIAEGGLLHDLGKRAIPTTILNKPGPLTNAEFKIIQTHPQVGYEELCGRSDVTFSQLMMVYQHHEKIDGTGYPVRITGEEMHPWARICAVVDVFDAMTCKRPYRGRMPLGDVLSHMERGAGAHLDKEMVRCWTSVMSEK